MGAIILRILGVVIVLWLIRRIIASFGVGGRAPQRRAEAQDSNVMVKDPVCGMYMDTRLAVHLEQRGETVYFCSEECKAKFLERAVTRL
ncbi:MAG: YHS domain-containing protein [Acidobacteriota bacterium]|jgi:YHS domain-containing protein|nr:YHS domain-containing protein [Acidobacteriota bacterium]